MPIRRPTRFSALQRAENSSMIGEKHRIICFRVSVLFSEPKIPQSIRAAITAGDWRGFSALQRAENSSIDLASYRRFPDVERFSALQRAENSSMQAWRGQARRDQAVSVLFSEPKIPQFWRVFRRAPLRIPRFQRAIRKPDLWYHDGDHAVLMRSNLVCHDVHFDPIQPIMRPI